MIDQPRLIPLHPLVAAQPPGEVDKSELRRLSGQMPQHLRGVVALYLRNCPIILALMEHTRDRLESRFSVSGGSAVLSDGTYFWRLDGANYVETYGVALPQDFIAHGESRRWEPPSLGHEQLLSIDKQLSSKRLPIDLDLDVSQPREGKSR